MQKPLIHIALFKSRLHHETPNETREAILGVSTCLRSLVASGSHWPRSSDGNDRFIVKRVPVLWFPFLVIRSFEDDQTHFFQLTKDMEPFAFAEQNPAGGHDDTGTLSSPAAGRIWHIKGEWLGDESEENEKVKCHAVDQDYLLQVIHWSHMWRNVFETYHLPIRSAKHCRWEDGTSARGENEAKQILD